MSLQNHQNALQIATLTALTIIFAGCDQAQPVSYKIPKEERSANVTVQPKQNTPSVTDPTQMPLLPGMQEAAEKSAKISYTVPESWEELPLSGIRKANFKVAEDNGSAEITVLTFPGDVGGRLANINRWRSQIGLGAATLEDITAYTKPYEFAGHQGLYVSLEGETQSILGALLPFHGNTWFFKMLGDTPVVLANEANMKHFLDSIKFEDHTH